MIKYYKKTSFILILFINIILNCASATVVITSADAHTAYSIEAKMAAYFRDINAFNKMYPQEKVYLHFDNTAYFLEETIWFKAYVMAANAQRQSHLSKVLYVELLSPEGAVLETKKYPIVNGGCHGEFHLDSLYLSGYYEVRAYTRYMLNFGDDAVFSRVFPVYKNVPEGNYHQKTILDRDLSRRKKVKEHHVWGEQSALWRFVNPSKAAQEKYYFEPVKPRDPKDRLKRISSDRAFDEQFYEKEKDIYIDFYPEGGALIEGVQQNIAFCIKDKEGKGLHATGRVYNAKNEQITAIAPILDGKGMFSIIVDDQPCHVQLYYNDGLYRFPLPEAQDGGCVLTLRHHFDNNLVEITTDYRHNEVFNDSIVAVALSHGGNIYRFELVETACMQRLHIPTHAMPEGVNIVSVFDREGRALAERLYFVRHENSKPTSLSIKDNSRGNDFDPYEKIKLKLQAKDADDKALPGQISISVRDAESDDLSFNTDNLYTWLLLSSELKGYIKQASYYFEKNDRVHQLHLDLLMLTQGWCRYNWQEMNQEQIPHWKQPLERALMADGAIYNTDRLRNPRLKNALMNMSFMLNDSVHYYGEVKTNDLGLFALQFPDFYGQSELRLFMQDRTLHKNHLVGINKWFSPAPKKISYYELSIPEPESLIGDQTSNYRIDDNLRRIDLNEVGISRKQHTRNIQKHYSLRHYNIAEELEYMFDTYHFGAEMYIEDPNLLVMSIMDRYNFPPNQFACVFAKAYYSDKQLPEGNLFWQTYKRRNRSVMFESLVIRSDSAIIEKYSLPILAASMRCVDDQFFRPGEQWFINQNIPAVYANWLMQYASLVETVEDRKRKENDFTIEVELEFPEKFIYKGEEQSSLSEDIEYPSEIEFPEERDLTEDVGQSKEIDCTRYTDIKMPKRFNLSSYESFLGNPELDCVAVFIPPADSSVVPEFPVVMGQRKTKIQGYSYSKEFVHPDYSGVPVQDLPRDYRRTLYWNPNVSLDENGRAEIEFFNNSTCRHLSISAEGLSHDGKPLVYKQ